MTASEGIPGWCDQFAAVYQAAINLFPAGSLFVEIGSFMGKSAVRFAEMNAASGKGHTLVCVDPWNLPPTEDVYSARGELDRLGVLSDQAFYEAFLRHTLPHAGSLYPIRLPSVEAATLFPDSSIPFIFIDGDHHAPAVEADIRAWAPKLALNGVMAGDDYDFPGVRAGTTAAFHPDPAFLLGSSWFRPPVPVAFLEAFSGHIR